jgi:ketosteroid isomerase-like protein
MGKMPRADLIRTLLASAIGLIAGIVLTTAVAARASLLADEETRRAVTAVKHAIVAGHKAKDAAALSRLYGEDYTAIDSAGVIRTKNDLLEALPTDAEIADGRYDLIAVRRWGNIAVATGRGHLVYRNADGSSRLSDYYSFNVFERRDGRWAYVAAFLP